MNLFKGEKKAEVLTRLKLLGVRSVEVSFSGGGDSGEITGVDAYDANNQPINIKEEIIIGEEKSETWNAEKKTWDRAVALKEMSLPNYIENLTYDALDETSLDWYNNDGGSGTLTIDLAVSPPEIKLDVEIYFTDSTNHQFRFSDEEDCLEEA